MTARAVLHGEVYSVYTRSVRMVLEIKNVNYTLNKIDPFDPSTADELIRLHPFHRVPVLQIDSFHLYETQAILDYVEDAFDGPKLRPVSFEAVARMRQVMGIADNYFYWPLVRQAFSHHVFDPLNGEVGDPSEIAAGLAAAPRVLEALEEIAQEGLTLRGDGLTLAECHLWPMMEYALMVPGIATLLDAQAALAAWVDAMRTDPVSIATKPDLSALKG